MINKFFNFLNNVGTDKVLHFCFGAIITFTISNFIIIQQNIIGENVLLITILGIVVAMFLEYIKEFVIDAYCDIKDVIATLFGCIFAFLINTISVIFYYLLN